MSPSPLPNPTESQTAGLADETALFRKAWSAYDAITEHNYMFHREIYALIGDLLADCRATGPYSTLDLGCGNAKHLAPCLIASPPLRYVGVDLSAAALAEARGHLDALGNVTLVEQDMLQVMSDLEESFNVIFSSFALHHLSSDSKRKFFINCLNRLAPGGEVILVDVARQEGESREQYLEGYLSTMRSCWTAVSSDHLEEACSHVADHDFPETLSQLSDFARAAGLDQISLLARHDQHHVISFRA